jgi:hypothetical protein
MSEMRRWSRFCRRSFRSRARWVGLRPKEPLRLSAAGRRVYLDIVPVARALQSALDRLMGKRFDVQDVPVDR